MSCFQWIKDTNLKVNHNENFPHFFPPARSAFQEESPENMGIRRRLALYNRVVWGRLYHETINDLRYELTQDIKDSITAKLKKISPEKL